MIRKLAWPSISLALAAAVWGCSSSSSSSGTGPWAGSYACTGTQQGTLTAPTMMMVNGNLSFTGTVVQNGNAITATAEPGDAGGPPCTLTGTANGNAFTLSTNPAQTCTQNTVLGMVTVTYTGGTATLSGNSFTAMFNISVSGPATGTGSQTFSCTRM